MIYFHPLEKELWVQITSQNDGICHCDVVGAEATEPVHNVDEELRDYTAVAADCSRRFIPI